MSNITPIAFVDVSMLSAGLCLKYRTRFADDKRRQQFPNSPHHDTETIVLRGPKDATPAAWFEDGEMVDYPIMKEWKAARIILKKIREGAAPLLGGKVAVLGKAMVVSLKAGGHVDWHVDEGEYAEAYLRTHTCLVPSPAAWLYSGGEAQAINVGWLHFFNNRVKHSAINMGAVARVHLIVDVRRPDVP